jgi:aconitate hydratase
MLIYPTSSAVIYRSASIGTPPYNTPMPAALQSRVAIKVADMINTDDIIPAGPAMNYRANIPKSSEFVFKFIDPQFVESCELNKASGLASVIIAGLSYGQGSSREHAALCPMYMGVRTVIAKSIERIHRDNLINFGILPLVFADPADYDHIEKDDVLIINNIYDTINNSKICVYNSTQNRSFTVANDTTARQRDIILAGGLLNFSIRK